MDKLQWIKELVRDEQQMEESGIVEVGSEFDGEKVLREATIEMLNDLKTCFIECSAAFNQIKSISIGQIKIYAIAKTMADFMLFRNGYKLLFNAKGPGRIQVTFVHSGSSFIPGAEETTENRNQDILVAQWGAFAQVNWTFNNKPIHLDYMVRYYLTRFIKESAK